MTTPRRGWWPPLLLALALALGACGDDEAAPDAGVATDGAVADAATPDAMPDGPEVDAPVTDAATVDAPVTDAPAGDAPVVDAHVTDAPAGDAPVGDAPVTDAAAVDAAAADAAAADAPADAPADAAPSSGPYTADLVMQFSKAAGGEAGLARRQLTYFSFPDMGAAPDYAYAYRLEGLNDPAGQLPATVRLTMYQGIHTLNVPANGSPPAIASGSGRRVVAVFEGSVSAGQLDLSLTSGLFSMATTSEENGYQNVRKARLTASIVPTPTNDGIDFIGGATASTTGRIEGIWPALAMGFAYGSDIHGLCFENFGLSPLDVLALGCTSVTPGLQPQHDVDGDGLERFLDTCPELVAAGITDVPGYVQCCVDGNGTVTVGMYCAGNQMQFEDGWQFFLDFRAIRALVTWN